MVTNGSRETCEEVTAITWVEPARHGAVKPHRWRVFESRHSDLSGRSAAPHSVSALLSAGHSAEGRAALDIVHPVRVDSGGSFLSYELWPRALRKRDLSARPSAPTFYELQYRGRELRFNLTANPHLLAPGFVSETRRRCGLGNGRSNDGWGVGSEATVVFRSRWRPPLQRTLRAGGWSRWRPPVSIAWGWGFARF